MKTFVMLIMLFHLDPDGYPYTSTMQESPLREFGTQRECESTAVIKRDEMLRSSLKFPDLGIMYIQIRCVDGSEADFDPRDITI